MHQSPQHPFAVCVFHRSEVPVGHWYGQLYAFDFPEVSLSQRKRSHPFLSFDVVINSCVIARVRLVFHRVSAHYVHFVPCKETG